MLRLCYLDNSFSKFQSERFEMKKNLKMMFIICVAFGAVFSGASSIYAQAVGGYKTIPVTDAAVVEAADVAVAAHNAEEQEITYKLIAVKSAER